MKQLNTLPIEDFLDRVRVAIKGNQKTVVLSIKDATDLQNSLSVVMTRLSGQLDDIATNNANSVVSINMDGGKF
jgi:hypothetical protein